MVRVARTREEALRRATERQEKRTRPSRRDARARDPARDQDDAGEEDVAPSKFHLLRGPVLDTRDLSFLTSEVFKLLLYVRGALPQMYDAMALELEEKENAAPASARKTKFGRFHAAFDRVLKCLERLVSSCDESGGVLEVLLVFGPSVRKPREAYLLRYSAGTPRARGGDPNQEDGRRRRAVQGLIAKVNRKLVSAVMAMEDHQKASATGRRNRRQSSAPKISGIPKQCKIHLLARTSEDLGQVEGFFPQIGISLAAIDPLVVELAPPATEAAGRAREGGEGGDCDRECLRHAKWWQSSVSLEAVSP